MNLFERVPLAPADPILGLTAAFRNDPRLEKVNLGVGVYREEDLTTPILASVKAAEQALVDEEPSKEYLPIEGDPLFTHQLGAVVFSEKVWNQQKARIVALQSVGGTGALHIGGALIKEELEGKVFIPSPTWPNHRGIFSTCQLCVDTYPYYDYENHCVDFEKMVHSLSQLPKRSIIVLHASCHNPTGADLSQEQWHHLCSVCETGQLIPFFDCAYQGFGKGIEEDVYAIRYFFQRGLEMFVALSCAKNFSLYGERVGCLFVVTDSQQVAINVLSRLKQIIRTRYSNPPLHGAKVVAYILSHPMLKEQWLRELTGKRQRIEMIRTLFWEKLTTQVPTLSFSHLRDSLGMFAFSGITQSQVVQLMTEFGIYMTGDGRINLCGLTLNNIDYVVEAIAKTVSFRR